MNSQNKILLGLLAAQLALVGVVNASRDRPKVQKPTQVFPGFEAAKVSEIEVSAPGPKGQNKPERVQVTKSGTTWGVASAGGYPADVAKVEAFLGDLQKLKSRGAVATTKTFHAKLEVSESEHVRKIVVTHDGKKLGFFLGSSPGLKKVHFRSDDKDEVLVVEGLSAWDVGSRPGEWVDRSYFKTEEKDVWGLKLANANGTIELEKSPQGEWALLGLPPKRTQKKSAIDELVRKASSISLEAPIGKEIRPEHGLDAPQATITLLTGTSTIAGVPPKSLTTKTLKIGKKDADNHYFLKSGESEFVVTGPSWTVEALVKKAPAELLEDEAAKK